MLEGLQMVSCSRLTKKSELRSPAPDQRLHVPQHLTHLLLLNHPSTKDKYFTGLTVNSKVMMTVRQPPIGVFMALSSRLMENDERSILFELSIVLDS